MAGCDEKYKPDRKVSWGKKKCPEGTAARHVLILYLQLQTQGRGERYKRKGRSVECPEKGSSPGTCVYFNPFPEEQKKIGEGNGLPKKEKSPFEQAARKASLPT